MIDKVAHYRAKSDLKNSLLHTYELFTQASDICVPYICRRTGISEADAKHFLSRPPILDEHWLDRAPWSNTPLVKPDTAHDSPIRVNSICINVGVLLTLSHLANTQSVDIDVRCNYLTPLEYWSTAAFVENVDVFVTELSSPFISEIKACEMFRLAFPIHKVAEGVLTSSPLLDLYPSTYRKAIVTEGTSTVTHAKANEERDPLILKSPRQWKTILSQITNRELFFAWEPWLYLIEKQRPDLHVIRHGQFIMGMFVNRLTLEDPVRQQHVLHFLDAFVRQWRLLQSTHTSVGPKSVKSLDSFVGWRDTFNRAMLVAVSPVESEHVVLTATREEVLELLNGIQKKIEPDPRIIERVSLYYDEIQTAVEELPEEQLFTVKVLMESLLKSREKTAWEKIKEIRAFILQPMPNR